MTIASPQGDTPAALTEAPATVAPASAAPTCGGCGGSKQRFDYLLWGSISVVSFSYLAHLLAPSVAGAAPYFGPFAAGVFDLMNVMWWGLALGIAFVGLLSQTPREFVMSVIGRPGTSGGVLKAAAAGVMLDLCNHGVVLVGLKLYERGASIGQVVAFLVASPWNSLSLTLILLALVGWQWTLLLILASAVIAVVSGLLFDWLVRRGMLPQNPYETDLPDDFEFWGEARAGLKRTRFDGAFFSKVARDGIRDSRMILRWILFGVALAAAIRAFVPMEHFQHFFGPTLMGLGLTVLIATIMEVCSEGSTPIAADLLNRAGAPGNAFAFLMTGVATDYTEIMGLRETTRSWRIALFLPLITVPQVLALALIMNGWSG